MKQNKAGQKVSTYKSSKIRGPLIVDLLMGWKKPGGFNKLCTSIVGLGRKKKDKKIFEIRILHALKTCEQSSTLTFLGKLSINIM